MSTEAGSRFFKGGGTLPNSGFNRKVRGTAGCLTTEVRHAPGYHQLRESLSSSYQKSVVISAIAARERGA